MQRRAKLFMNNRSQAVRLPKDFRFNVDEVLIRKEGSDVTYRLIFPIGPPNLSDAPTASAGFMEGIEDLPAQERKS